MKTLSLAILLSFNAIAQAGSVDFEKQKAEILDHYQAQIRIDTSSPPGNEIKAVEYLQKALAAEGIPRRCSRSILAAQISWPD
jgi:hypothetical protein